jgi:hypothetical protein
MALARRDGGEDRAETDLCVAHRASALSLQQPKQPLFNDGPEPSPVGAAASKGTGAWHQFVDAALVWDRCPSPAVVRDKGVRAHQ